MKHIILGTVAGLAAMALAPVNAFAHVDVRIDLGVPFYVDPPPVYYEPPPRYYSPPPPVYYGPGFVYHDRDWGDRNSYRHNDQGRHRGHRNHRDDDHDRR